MSFDIQNISRIKDEFPQKRDCFSELMDYLKSDNPHKICALYGLRRTGKTVLMQQALLNLPESEKQKADFITCNSTTDFHEVLAFIQSEIEKGKKYFFIDEITYAKGFQEIGEILSDNFVSFQDARIVVTGTDSLGLSLPSHSILYDRIKMIHTSYMSFAEFSRVTGNKLIDYYLKHGSTLSNVSPFENYSSANEYIESSIVENFIRSLEKSEGIRSYPPVLTELYESKDLENAIQRIINQYSQNITLRALRKQFELSPLKNGINAFSRRKENTDFEIKDTLKIEFIESNVKKLLKIDDSPSKIKEDDFEKIKNFLKEMDVITCIPVMTSLNGKSEAPDMELITHPGMYHANLGYTIEQLKKDDNWLSGATFEQKDTLLKSVYETTAGKIQENFIIADVYKMLAARNEGISDFDYVQQSRWYVSKLSTEVEGKMEEVDLIVADRKKKETFLFEIKHSTKVVKEQSAHLESNSFLEYIESKFGKVKERIVLYNGKSDVSLKVPRINISDFLRDMYKYSKNKEYSIGETTRRLISRVKKEIERGR